MTHLLQRSGRLPRKLIQDDVEMNESRPIGGGGYAQVFLGRRAGGNGRYDLACKKLFVEDGKLPLRRRVRYLLRRLTNVLTERSETIPGAHGMLPRRPSKYPQVSWHSRQGRPILYSFGIPSWRECKRLYE